jgi:hypothetical protein
MPAPLAQCPILRISEGQLDGAVDRLGAGAGKSDALHAGQLAEQFRNLADSRRLHTQGKALVNLRGKLVLEKGRVMAEEA